MNDYRTLLAEAYALWVRWPEEVRKLSFDDILLAPRVPWLCPDCKGHEMTTIPPWEGPNELCYHQNAPTIGDLLRWGENVAKAEFDPLDDHVAIGWNARLAVLRTEADQ